MNVYRQSAPHPDARICRCGWRHPTRFLPIVRCKGPASVEAMRVYFTCPDCGLEHVTDEVSTQPSSTDEGTKR